MNENEVSKVIFDAGLKVHRQLGVGLLESAYEECLYYELQKSGLLIEKQKPMPLIYDDIKLDIGYRIDLLVERKVVVEIKSVESLNEIHIAQVLTYLKLSNCKLGLLINFNSVLFKNGVKRLINGTI
ncbi:MULTISPECIES: GxxExxY protein [unclassified Chryseobacterium]|uniref:GxxExxY protein n=1 Tax=unclassified Chryseobacterium TaxID=2593645 RepID=UPI000D3C3FCF|nr:MULTISPECIES: GxxExxY protein [unclassified Chryseobacterium]PTT70880.1 GxxExxY protein [Chryseobacterium sp. HMWF001]PVV56885.1 GxxExxY protein [Chryseobacterium sp. HMWF035]